MGHIADVGVDEHILPPTKPGEEMSPDEALAVLKELRASGDVSPEKVVEKLAKIREETGKKVEAATENPALARFKTHYDHWNQADKAKVIWEEVQGRLLENNGQKLNLASALHEGGVMFGVDQEGKILFADGGEDATDIPETTGKNYPDTRETVYFRKDEDGKKVPTGYEMFPYKEPYEKSPEMLAFEAFTGHPFVKSKDDKEWRYSWLESGENPVWPRYAFFNPVDQAVRVSYGVPRVEFPRRGVRRLLRV